MPMNRLSAVLRLPVRNISKGLPTQLSRTTAAKSLTSQISHTHRKALPTSLQFSTYSRLFNKPSHDDSKSDYGYLGSKPDVPLAMSFQSIGIRKNMKLLLFMFICVSGTIQLFIWSEELWKWWKGAEGDEIGTA